MSRCLLFTKNLFKLAPPSILKYSVVPPEPSSDLNIMSLVDKVKTGQVKELIFAMSPTMEGDTTNFYIFRQIQDYNVATSTIARGVAAGNELEYTDEITLGRSIIDRVPFEASLKS